MSSIKKSSTVENTRKSEKTQEKKETKKLHPALIAIAIGQILQVANAAPSDFTVSNSHQQRQALATRIAAIQIDSSKIDPEIVDTTKIQLQQSPSPMAHLNRHFTEELGKFAVNPVNDDDSTTIDKKTCFCHSNCYGNHSDCGHGTPF